MCFQKRHSTVGNDFKILHIIKKMRCRKVFNEKTGWICCHFYCNRHADHDDHPQSTDRADHHRIAFAGGISLHLQQLRG